jgi:hypothetical protein
VAGLDLGVKQDHSALVVLAGSRESLQLRLVYARNWAPDPKTGRVDLVGVECAVLHVHQRFGLATCGYDPHQAALMAQRLELQKVPMQEMTFTGKNLNLMASTMLDVFRSRRIELFEHPGLIADLSRLTIEEKSYGYRLSAVRNETGHADLAVALSIALPIAVGDAGKVPVVAGVYQEDMDLSPFERHLRNVQRQADAINEDRRRMNDYSERDYQTAQAISDLGGWRRLP